MLESPARSTNNPDQVDTNNNDALKSHDKRMADDNTSNNTANHPSASLNASLSPISNQKKLNTWSGHQHSLFSTSNYSSDASNTSATELSSDVRCKLDALVEKYTFLLESQLEQQQHFYEKRLRRETFQAFYQSLSNSVKHITPNTTNTNTSTSITSESAVEQIPHPSMTKKKSTTATSLTTAAATTLSTAATIMADDTFTGINEGDNNNHHLSDSFLMIEEEDFSTIVSAKSAISAIEYEHAQNNEKLREVEIKTRKVMKENDVLLRMQQTHQNKIAEIDRVTVEKQAAFEDEVGYYLLLL
jgi:hypothetical protein